MFKIRKYFLYIMSIIYVILTIIEFIKYLNVNSNLFGLIYMIINLLILFLLIPTVYNYKNNYSKIRFSKFVVIIILGVFNSYVLKSIVIGNMSYIDASIKYNDSIFVIKNILKVIIYFGYVLLALIDIKAYKTIKKYINNRKKLYK